jgi:hypothetical protein
MKLVLSPAETRVTVEVHAAGLLSAAAHDLRVAAESASGESADGTSLSARFPIEKLRIAASRRHGTREWHDPSRSDAADIEQRIRTEVFVGGGAGGAQVDVEGSVENGRAQLTVRAPGGTQRLATTVTVDTVGDKTRVRGACDLSLRALGTGPPRVPFGAIKLQDAVHVEFDVTLSKID